MRIELIGVKLPLINPGDDLAEIIIESIESSGEDLLDNDILVITEKVVAKALGRIVDLDEVRPSKRAIKIASRVREDPRFVELVLRESDDILAVVPVKELVERGIVDLYSLSRSGESLKLLDDYPFLFIVEREGMLWSDSGIDSSNAPPGKFLLPLEDHDEAAKQLCFRIRELTGRRVAVVICDTEFFLGGSLDFARGSYGIDPVDRGFGSPDLYGKPKYGGVDMIAHELCSASALLFKQSSEGVPVAIVRGLEWRECECKLREAIPCVDLRRAASLTLRRSVEVLGIMKVIKSLFKLL
jgi:coenzyme F420-0:L-glutamate ligase/coenzyme F420-1:gamma-L-glutamate ligase